MMAQCYGGSSQSTNHPTSARRWTVTGPAIIRTGRQYQSHARLAAVHVEQDRARRRPVLTQEQWDTIVANVCEAY